MAAASTSPRDRTVILAAALYGGGDLHGGSFSSGVKANTTTPQSRLSRALSAFASHSPGLEGGGPFEVHVLHDVPALDGEALAAAQRTWQQSQKVTPLTLHRFEPLAIPGAELRWRHAAAVLRQLLWDCAFVVDLADVSVLHVPVCGTLHEHLHMASDFCTGGQTVRDLLRGAWTANEPALSALSSARRDALASWLRPRKSGDASEATIAPTVNCGVVGGPRAAFEPALREVVERFELSWRRSSTRHEYSDMLMWNELSLHLHRSVVSGYPHGPVNHPMHGILCPGDLQSIVQACGNGSALPRCRVDWLRHHRIDAAQWHDQLYWFGHKIFGHATALALYREHTLASASRERDRAMQPQPG